MPPAAAWLPQRKAIGAKSGGGQIQALCEFFPDAWPVSDAAAAEV